MLRSCDLKLCRMVQVHCEVCIGPVFRGTAINKGPAINKAQLGTNKPNRKAISTSTSTSMAHLGIMPTTMAEIILPRAPRLITHLHRCHPSPVTCQLTVKFSFLLLRLQTVEK